MEEGELDVTNADAHTIFNQHVELVEEDHIDSEMMNTDVDQVIDPALVPDIDSDLKNQSDSHSGTSAVLRYDETVQDDPNYMVGNQSYEDPYYGDTEQVYHDSSSYSSGELYDPVTYPVDSGNVYRRAPRHSESFSDIDTDSDNESAREYMYNEERKEQVDPGPFKYNRTMCMAAIPCSVLVIALAGEMLILLMCFAAALILLVDPGGNEKRSVVIFVFLFIPCHGLVIYSFFPFIWLSVANLLLIGAANLFVLFTGGWVLLQFSIFRKQETDICVVIEQLLFIPYPAACVVLLTWALSTLIPGQFVSYMLILIGFLYLQVFTTPRSSCFKLSEKDVEDFAIIAPPYLLVMILTFVATPSFLHLMVRMYASSFSSIFQLSFLMQLLFVFTLSLFLTTLLSLRHIFEHNGWPYSIVTRARWVTGFLVTLLCYPVLRNFGLPSHFLPWLPGAIAVYSAYGLLLHYKKLKMFTAFGLLGAVTLFFVWMMSLPWELKFPIAMTEIQTVYILLCINAVLCLSALYAATYWRQEILCFFICLQTSVFILTEIMLYVTDLYGGPLIIISGLLMTFTLHRLQVALKLPGFVASLCITAHITKTAVISFCLLFEVEQGIHLINCLTAYGAVYMIGRTFQHDTRPEISRKEVLRNIVLLWICVGLNAYPYLYTATSFLTSTHPTPANIFGLCVVIAGILTLAVSNMLLEADDNSSMCGLLAIIAGCVTCFLSPDLHMSWYSVLQWSELASAFITIIILLVNFSMSFLQIVLVSGLTAICPALRVFMLMYKPEDVDYILLVTAIEYMLITASLLCIVYSFCKSKASEEKVVFLCKWLGVLMVLVLVTDLLSVEVSADVLSLPVWWTWLVTTGAISAALKLVTTKLGSTLIPLTRKTDDKDVRSLPVIGNLATVMAFMLACLVSPMSGFLWDVWCCGASLILVCLQKDGYFLRGYHPNNPVNPTISASMAIMVMMSIIRCQLWTWVSAWSIFSSMLELLFLSLVLPSLYVLWGIVWKSKILLSEQLVVFLSPLNLFVMLCASSSTSFMLGVFGLLSMVWMMVYVLPLEPFDEPSFKTSRR